MKQILVAVDGHPHADQVVKNAIQLARALDAGIVLTYVVRERKIPEEYRDSHGDSLPEHYYQDQFLRTVGLFAEKIEEAGIKCERMYQVGNPETEILKTAKSMDASYIVVGIHGFTGLSRLKAIGDVARNVIERSQLPVMVVPQEGWETELSADWDRSTFHAPKPPVSVSEYRFRSELSPTLTIVVKASSEDGAKEELARIGLHPSFFELIEESQRPATPQAKQ